MRQRAFPFQIPDSVLLEILGKIHEFNHKNPELHEWFYSVMLLLDEHADVHFGDLVVALPSANGNGNSSGLEFVSYKEGDITRYDNFPNPFVAHAYQRCTNKKYPELMEISMDQCPQVPDLPYSPAVVPLGCYEYHLGVFAAGSYNDRALVMRNRRFFKILGIEISRFLFARHMNRMVSSVLFEHEEDSLSFENLLTFKFKQLLEKIDPETGGNIMGDVTTLVEKILIQLALEKTGHKVGHAASLLGINRNTLRKKIRAFDIKMEDM